MIYLASPYTHPDRAERRHRFENACRCAGRLMRLGYIVFSPIAHSHPIEECGAPTDWPFWERQERPFLDLADLLVVLMLDGWEASEGVEAEVKYMAAQGKPIVYVTPLELFSEGFCLQSPNP